MGTRLNQRGFSLLGMSLAISLAMSFLIYTTPMILKTHDTVLSRATAERVRLVYDGAYNHYIDEGAWPVDVNSLVAAGYLSPGAVETVWGSPITLAASGSNLLLSFTVPDNKFVQMIRGLLPDPTVVGTTMTEQLAPPGQQVSLLALQDLAGTRAWTGDYNADGHNLNNLNDLNASGDVSGARFVDNDDPSFSLDPNQTSRLNYADLNVARLRNSYSEGAACTTKQIGTTSTGEMLSCVAGRWAKVGGAMGGRTAIGFNTTYCPGENVFVYAHKQSAGAALQGLYIYIGGSVAARSVGQSEGHMGYESVGIPVSASECFRIADVGGGQNRYAWYRTL